VGRQDGQSVALDGGTSITMNAQHVAFSPDGRVVAVGGDEVLLWQSGVNGRLLVKLEARVKNNYHSVSFAEVVFLRMERRLFPHQAVGLRSRVSL